MRISDRNLIEIEKIAEITEFVQLRFSSLLFCSLLSCGLLAVGKKKRKKKKKKKKKTKKLHPCTHTDYTHINTPTLRLI